MSSIMNIPRVQNSIVAMPPFLAIMIKVFALGSERSHHRRMGMNRGAQPQAKAKRHTRISLSPRARSRTSNTENIQFVAINTS